MHFPEKAFQGRWEGIHHRDHIGPSPPSLCSAGFENEHSIAIAIASVALASEQLGWMEKDVGGYLLIYPFNLGIESIECFSSCCLKIESM